MNKARLPDVESIFTGVLHRVASQNNLSGQVVDAVKAMLGDYRVEYFKQSDFTVAVLSTKQDSDSDRVTFVGVSKRNPEDRQNPLRGKALALSRAAREAIQFELGRFTEITKETLVVHESSLFSRSKKTVTA